MSLMTLYSFKQLNRSDLEQLTGRPAADWPGVIQTVTPILESVRVEGDTAVLRYTEQFDGITPDPAWIDPNAEQAVLPKAEKSAIDQAIRNVALFHSQQQRGTLRVETSPGISCSRVSRPIDRVGLYIPGGSAPLPSTAIMLAVPATVAGCSTLVMATPPDQDGRVPQPIRYIAQETGVKGILLAGGAQAIAAMAYGTETVPKVDKLFGPGNQYVTAAKMALQNSNALVSIDLPAGPSELLVIADRSANPEWIAADLLSQAEHGEDSQVVLVSLPGFDLDGLNQSLTAQLNTLPRKKIAEEALKKSFILSCATPDEAIRFSNLYAPEHLILNTRKAAEQTDQIQNAGSVFVGPWTPESLGDYASGTNHTLPTYGYARMYSGVSLESFQKQITFQTATESGLREIGTVVETLAEMEGLSAHARAVRIRLGEADSRTDGSTKQKTS
ncbi:MAG: histidinol dehydrogenase [Balneolaceae bacterium]